MDEVVLVLDRLNRRLNVVERNQGAVIHVSSSVTDVTNNLSSAAVVTKSGTKAKKAKKIKTKKVKTTKKKNAQLTTPYIDPGTLADVPDSSNGTRSALSLGTLANMPVAPPDGTLYQATDAVPNGTTFRYSASLTAWLPIANSTTASGTWTPTLFFNGGFTGITYSEQQGFYIQTGNLIIAGGGIILTSKGTSTGNAQIGGLPGTCVTFDGSVSGGCIVFIFANMNFSALGRTMRGIVGVAGTPLILLYRSGPTTGTGVATDSDFTNTSELYFIAFYQV